MTQRRQTPLKPVTIEAHHCTPEEQRRLLGGTPFFRELSPTDIDRIAAAFQQAEYAETGVIHFSGDPATRLSIVAAGIVKLVRRTIEGQDVLLDVLASGDYFGSLADLGDDTYREDAVAQTRCCILYTTADEYRHILRQYPAVALATLDLVATRLRSAQETIEQVSAHSVDQRVAATLVKLARRLGREEHGDILIDMPLSRQDLADMTGATVETVSRVMSDFRRAGLIVSGRRWIAVRDEEALASIAETGSR
jgi:CRP/FNR family transcriptional regulator, nitrogen oxide reductase regulator